MSSAPLRLLVVDDTALYRKILAEAAGRVPGFAVVGAVSSGPLALARLSAEPCDLVLLDVFMPEMNGPEVLERIRRDHPRTAVVMISGATGADAEITINALSNGALDFIPKPQTASFAEGMDKLVAQLTRVAGMVRLRRGFDGIAAGTPPPPAIAPRPAPFAGAAGAPFATSPAAAPRPRMTTPPVALEILVIGVSTGGPKALQELLPRIPANFRLPIVIVQHMPPLFTRTLAEQLTKVCAMPVAEAGDGESVRPGRMLIAPGGRHLELVREADTGAFRTRLTDAPPVNSCRPAVDVLFQSVARCAPRGVLSLILTGMGEDGAGGVAALKAAVPTWSLVQDEASCVIFGMPQAIVRRGLDDEVWPLSALASRLVELARTRS